MLKRPGGPLKGNRIATKSELLPGMFHWRRLFTKGRLVPAIAIIACCVGLFNLNERATANVLNAGRTDYVWSLLGLCVSVAVYLHLHLSVLWQNQILAVIGSFGRYDHLAIARAGVE